ncbi:MAG: hypothetical protein IV090_10220 [Candidatus Sericytochromatia bacterium]|nr:hypothetical protein [Candidatus Sericytochromatia bacterium]
MMPLLKTTPLVLLLAASLSAAPAWAQTHTHPPATEQTDPTATDHTAMNHTEMDHTTHANPVTHTLMQRARTLGSGTSLLPQESPMRMWSLESGDWLWMFHGDLVGGYNQQGGPRGAQTWAAENWAMAMGSGQLGPGILDLRAMFSLEALTLPPGGTPELFQTGETYQNLPLRDRQHPHDLLMELAARYTYQPSPDLNFFGYAGLAGEPALGPSAFMHRPSGADNHWAPLAHHLQDATHISYGVGTLGARWQMFQLEASLFNGREPDENRFNLDFGPLDSWSTRLSWIPSQNWVAQVSYGQLKSPEALEPGDVHRSTASVTHVTELGEGLLSSTAIWGMNQEFHGESRVLHSFGLESQYDWDMQRNHVYGRLEVVDKSGLDLIASSEANHHNLYRITALTLGGIRELDWSEHFDLGLGADASLYFGDAQVRQTYGEMPYGFRVYLRLRPPTMQHTAPAATAETESRSWILPAEDGEHNH